jgi:hypothetical protein
MEVRGQLHAPAALPPGKEPLVPMLSTEENLPLFTVISRLLMLLTFVLSEF